MLLRIVTNFTPLDLCFRARVSKFDLRLTCLVEYHSLDVRKDGVNKSMILVSLDNIMMLSVPKSSRARKSRSLHLREAWGTPNSSADLEFFRANCSGALYHDLGQMSCNKCKNQVYHLMSANTCAENANDVQSFISIHMLIL